MAFLANSKENYPMSVRLGRAVTLASFVFATLVGFLDLTRSSVYGADLSPKSGSKSGQPYIAPQKKAVAKKPVYRARSKKRSYARKKKQNNIASVQITPPALPQVPAPDDIVYGDSPAGLSTAAAVSLGDTVFEHAILPKGVVQIKYQGLDVPKLDSMNSTVIDSILSGSAYDQFGDTVRFTIDPALQAKATEILQKSSVPYGAIVALDPRTGRVLALASHSSAEKGPSNFVTRGGFPAASLFKLITAAAAIENSGLGSTDLIKFRGGTYALGKGNYLPDARRDKRFMSFAEALGKSCNPVFARVGVNNLSSNILSRYAENFGFNAALPFEAPVERSEFHNPADTYEIARTAAGFTGANISPLHAAVIASTIANHGRMMRPYIIDRVINDKGEIKYLAQASVLKNVILDATSRELLEMMTATVETGTARRHFAKLRKGLLRNIDIAAKTGTLRGDSPKGIYHWFVAAAPVDNPTIALAALVIDPGNARINGSGVGRQLLEFYFGSQLADLRAQVASANKGASQG